MAESYDDTAMSSTTHQIAVERGFLTLGMRKELVAEKLIEIAHDNPVGLDFDDVIRRFDQHVESPKHREDIAATIQIARAMEAQGITKAADLT